MVDERRLVQSCVSHINNAKSDIESFNRSARDQKIKDELGLAYNSLNDCINHCNTALKQLQ